MGKISTFLTFPHISINFCYISVDFPYFCPHFQLQVRSGGRLNMLKLKAGFPAHQGNQGNQGKIFYIFPVREKSGNLIKMPKIREKSGNFDFPKTQK